MALALLLLSAAAILRKHMLRTVHGQYQERYPEALLARRDTSVLS
jgi:hypothetical protein